MPKLKDMPQSTEQTNSDEKDFAKEVELGRAKSREAARKQLAEAEESGDEETIAAAQKEMNEQYGNYSVDTGDGVAPELRKIIDDAGMESRDKSLVADEIKEKGKAAFKAKEAEVYATLESDLSRIQAEGEERLATQKKEEEKRAEAQEKQEEKSRNALKKILDLMSGRNKS